MQNSIKKPTVKDIKDFIVAAKRGEMESLTLFIDTYGGQFVDVADDTQCTALTWASFMGHTHAVCYLLEQGALIDIQDKSTNTPLMWAAMSNRVDTVALLLDLDAYIEYRNVDGFTPLMWAAREGHDKVVKLLLERGADVTATDYEGKTAIDPARVAGFTLVVRLLEEHAEELWLQSVKKEVDQIHQGIVQSLPVAPQRPSLRRPAN